MHKNLAPAALALSAALLLLGSAQADVRCTTEMSFSGVGSTDAPPPGMAFSMRTIKFVKNRNERQEQLMQIGPMQINTVTLTQCAKQQTVKMDPSLKIYTVAPIEAMQFGPPKMSRPERETMKTEGGKPGVGKVVTTFSVQDMGTEKVANLDTRHALLGIRSQTSGCLGTSDTNTKIEVWTAPLVKTLACNEQFAPTRTVPNEKGCQITYEMNGDLEKFRDAFGSLIVKQIIYDNNKPMATIAMKDYSQAALDDSLFDVPADFKKVSASEFQKAQQDAMQKKMRDGTLFETPIVPPTEDPKDGDAPKDGDEPKTEKKKKRGGFRLPGTPRLPF